MLNTALTRALTACLVSSLAACSTPEGGAGVPYGTVDDLVAFQESFSGAYCDRITRCGSYLDAAQHTECVAYISWLTGLSSDLVKGSVGKGRTLFSIRLAEACLSEVQSLTCNEALDLEGTCDLDSMFVGAVAEGGACYMSFECLGDKLACRGDDLCERSCQRVVMNPGEACDDMGLSCDGELGSCEFTSGSVGLCVAYLEEGDSCGQATTSGECNPKTTFCDLETSECVAKLGQGATCLNLSQCQQGLFCQIELGYTSGTCAQPLTEGATCRSDWDCQSDYCDHISHTCSTRRRTVGQSCSEYQYCVASYCEGVTPTALGTCMAYGALNDSCTPSMDHCGNGLFCDPETLVCTVPGSQGAPCTGNSEPSRCKLFLTCRDGSCQTLGSVDDPCDEEWDYPSCLAPNRCDANLCTAPLPAGEACSSNQQCASQDCDWSSGDGVCAEACVY